MDSIKASKIVREASKYVHFIDVNDSLGLFRINMSLLSIHNAVLLPPQTGLAPFNGKKIDFRMTHNYSLLLAALLTLTLIQTLTNNFNKQQ